MPEIKDRLISTTKSAVWDIGTPFHSTVVTLHGTYIRASSAALPHPLGRTPENQVRFWPHLSISSASDANETLMYACYYSVLSHYTVVISWLGDD